MFKTAKMTSHDTTRLALAAALLAGFTAVVLLATFLATPDSSYAELSEKRACNSHEIQMGTREYVFYKHKMSCERAKRFAHRVYESNGHWRPDGFKCTSGSNFNSGGSCFKRHGENEYFGWHPYD